MITNYRELGWNVESLKWTELKSSLIKLKK